MNANETLRTYSHLWPSSDDKTRQVLERAFARSDALVVEPTPPLASTQS